MAFKRSGRTHPEAMDLWLESQGYCRKPIARDGSCLFRAVAEQVFKSQTFHLDVRSQCVDYMKRHTEIFSGHEISGSIESYLNLMLAPIQGGGILEILAISKLYQVDVLLFQEVGIAPQNVTNNLFTKSIMLCVSPEQQYDSVYSTDFTKVAAFCQSLVYELLYKGIFHMKDVDFAVSQMLHQKTPRHRGEFGGSIQRKLFSFGSKRGVSLRSLMDDDQEEINVKEMLAKGITPFPYKVAKSLDPNVYRNVELDVWIDFRRGLRYFGSHNELRVGVKCFVKIDDATYIAHIQEMEPNCGPVLVFVEELGEKRSVPYENLELMPQELQTIKPLPLLSSGTNQFINNISKTSVSLSDFSKVGKLRKRRSSGDEQKIKENGCLLMDQRVTSTRKGRFRSRIDLDSSTINQEYQEENDPPVPGGFQNFTVDSFGNTVPSYQTNMDSSSGITLTSQPHILMQSQPGSPPILIPLSPRPEDIPAHWLQANPNMDPLMMASVSSDCGVSSGMNRSLLSNDTLSPMSYSSRDQTKVAGQEPNLQNFVKENSVAPETDINSNYIQSNLSNGEINYNAPKSILENGADLPLSDIQTLRFFYNLGNEVYHAQYGMYSFGGFAQGFGQPCAPSTPSPIGSPGMCPGKFCPCGPVCITTVPTIHHLLEPSTPPPNSRQRRKNSVNCPIEGQSSESHPSSQNTLQLTATSSLASRSNKKDSKGKGKKDLKVYQGQPLQHSTPVSSSNSVSQSSAEEEKGQDNDTFISADMNGGTAVPYSPTYSYVYCPSSPGIQFSPLENDPYLTPLRLQCSREYLPDTPQSPTSSCFPLNGELYTNHISLFPSSPHYLFPGSPNIYVGSPPSWTPITPPPPAQ